MASTVILPKFKAWVPVTGVPAAAYCLRTYAAGTTTNQAVFTDAACTIPAANPVVLDSNGESIIYAVAGTLYKFSLYDPTNTVQQSGWPVDSVTIGGGSGGSPSTTVSEWIASNLVPAYIGGTSFSFPAAAGNLTSTYSEGRVLQTTNTSGTVYSIIVSSSFGTFTTVTVTPYVPGGTNLDSGLSVVNYGVLNAANPSSPGRSVVSAQYSHNTDVWSTGTAQTIGTAIGLTVAGGLAGGGSSNLGEFSTSTGLFTAGRGGSYLVTAEGIVNSSGVTFNGSSLLQTVGSGFPIISSAPLSPNVTGMSTVSSTLSQLTSCVAGQTLGVKLLLTFSGGAPTVNSITLSIIGPL